MDDLHILRSTCLALVFMVLVVIAVSVAASQDFAAQKLTFSKAAVMKTVKSPAIKAVPTKTPLVHQVLTKTATPRQTMQRTPTPRPTPGATLSGQTDWVAKGNQFMNTGQYSRALDAYDQALALDPGSSAALTGKIQALTKLGRTWEALQLALGEYDRLTQQVGANLAYLGLK
jgi:tetratricopeptide (TPR) repeat protein